MNNLEKSKVIIVNLTPKTDQFESFKQRTNAVLLNEKHDMEDRLNETEMDENIFLNDNHTKEIHYNKVVETPILSSCSKSKINLSHRKTGEPLMTIDEEIHDLNPNPILNKMSHNYYDNIIKNKNMNLIEESVPIASIDSYADSVYNPTLTDQHRAGYMDKCYMNQMVQFPTPQYNRDKRNQTDSIDLDCNIENNPDRFRLNKINQNNQIVQKSLETFYDGKRLWTAAIDLKPPNKEGNLATTNIKYIYEYKAYAFLRI